MYHRPRYTISFLASFSVVDNCGVSVPYDVGVGVDLFLHIGIIPICRDYMPGSFFCLYLSGS